MSQPATADLVISGGRVIDPASGFDGVADVAVSEGRIIQVGANLAVPDAGRTIDARGLLVVPGLIDMHAHVYTHMGVSIDPDLAGVRSGVTTIVDAGTAGPYTWGPFMHNVIATAQTRTLAFLHIGRTGQSSIPEIRSAEDIDLAATIQTARDHPGVILGIKLRAVGPAVATMGGSMVDLTRQAARESGGRQMIHIGDFDAGPGDPAITREVVTRLDAGDVLSHIFTDRHGSLLDERGRILPEVLEARDRGVVMESSPGRGNFSFAAARQLLDLGLLPDVIATDITTPGRGWLVYSLPEVMSRFMALGFSLTDVIRMTTVAPANVLGLGDSIGALAPGREADVTLLREEHGSWIFRDLNDATLPGDTALVPVLTVRAGELIVPDWGPHPWGWLPESDGS
ncbi:MAG TPA: amidohydrolase/deacetylase family metallohydrolase [Thermomicrobiales bacterium]|nr:amidohydrolase/deacetylase family metallohydrolase [Thermomicrobiales bacterium]